MRQTEFLPQKAPVSWGATSADWLLVRTARASIGTLRDARIIYLAANYIVGIALLEPLQARLTARRGLCGSGWSQQHHQR